MHLLHYSAQFEVDRRTLVHLPGHKSRRRSCQERDLHVPTCLRRLVTAGPGLLLPTHKRARAGAVRATPLLVMMELRTCLGAVWQRGVLFDLGGSGGSELLAGKLFHKYLQNISISDLKVRFIRCSCVR